MEQMAFSSKWQGCIMGFISSRRASILVNGLATKEFAFKCGVRQGDPMDRYLFILSMEGLRVTMQSACERNLFQEINLPNDGPHLLHLMYANNVTFIGEWSGMNLVNLKRI